MAKGQDSGLDPSRKVTHEAHMDKMHTEWATRMGVPKQWVTGHSTAKFSGSIAGFTGAKGDGNIHFTAESTGGGATDSHSIPFKHPYMDSGSAHHFNKFFGTNPNNPSAGAKWVAEGRMAPNGIRADSGQSMHWTLRPHNSQLDD
jgi:hypothetical protein